MVRLLNSFIHILLVITSCFFFAAEARPFNILKPSSSRVRIIGFFNGLAMKDGGPSAGGGGHSFINAETLGGIKNSGPSPGEGNKFTNTKTLGGIKNSGQSPGGPCHSLVNAGTLGGIKAFGDELVATNIQILGGRKDGPSPGAGH